MPAIYTCDKCGKPAEGEDYDGAILCPYHDAVKTLEMKKDEYVSKREWLKETHLKNLAAYRRYIRELEDKVRRLEVEAMYKIVDGKLFVSRSHFNSQSPDAQGIGVAYLKPSDPLDDPFNVVLFESVEFRREDDYWWRYDGDLDYNEVLKALGLQE